MCSLSFSATCPLVWAAGAFSLLHVGSGHTQPVHRRGSSYDYSVFPIPLASHGPMLRRRARWQDVKCCAVLWPLRRPLRRRPLPRILSSSVQIWNSGSDEGAGKPGCCCTKAVTAFSCSYVATSAGRLGPIDQQPHLLTTSRKDRLVTLVAKSTFYTGIKCSVLKRYPKLTDVTITKLISRVSLDLCSGTSCATVP